MLSPVVPVLPTVSQASSRPVQSCRCHFVAWQEDPGAIGRVAPSAPPGDLGVGTRYLGVGTRYLGVGTRYLGVGTRYLGVGTRYLGVGTRYLVERLSDLVSQASSSSMGNGLLT
jgi:hypothetical protein